MSLDELRKIAEGTAVRYYDSGISGISFGDTSHKEAVALLASQGSKTSLKKDILSMQKKMGKEFSDESVFEDSVKIRKGMKKEYEKVLSNRFASGTEDAKKVFNKYVKPNSIGDYEHQGRAYFWPLTKKIKMNYAKDCVNPKGPGTTFFHEHGHYIDFAARPKGSIKLSTSNSTFGDLLRSDFEEYTKKVKVLNNLSVKEDAYRIIRREISDDKHHAISDLFGGLSENKCRGAIGHKNEYWSESPDNVVHEAFAHMFESSFDFEKREIMLHYFPNAYAEFERLIKEVLI